MGRRGVWGGRARGRLQIVVVTEPRGGAVGARSGHQDGRGRGVRVRVVVTVMVHGACGGWK